MELEEEDLIEIAEEAELIQAERIIEDNWGPKGGRDGRKKGDMDDALRVMEEMMLAMNLDKEDIKAEQSENGWEVKMNPHADTLTSIFAICAVPVRLIVDACTCIYSL